MQLLVKNCLDPSRATKIFSVPKWPMYATEIKVDYSIPYPSCSQRENCCPLNRENNLVCSSYLKPHDANELLLGDPRQADQRMQSFNFFIVIHQSLDPTAQVPRLLSLHACMNQSSIFHFLAPTSALEHLST